VQLLGLTAYGQVRRSTIGTVEFIGLEQWTPELIQRKLGYQNADGLHYCAQDLKAAGFPDVSVVGYMEDGRRYSVVTVLEPSRAHDALYLKEPRGTVRAPAHWSDLRALLQDPQLLSGAVLDYGRTLPTASQNQPWLADGLAQPWWEAARQLDNATDLRNALRVLPNDADPLGRITAAAVLMNFPAEDSAWRALFHGLRDHSENVRTVCFQALNSWATYAPKRVDWNPAQNDIAIILRGTNLFAFPFALKTLTVTHIDATLARKVLRGGGARLPLAYLMATHGRERELGRGFLIQLRGRDLGDNAEPWRAWISAIR
jgi:hypothetical protein